MLMLLYRRVHGSARFVNGLNNAVVGTAAANIAIEFLLDLCL
jgi:hypothetical protein